MFFRRADKQCLMSEHLSFGASGEDRAVVYLKRKGYAILERNWHSGHKELDIIARRGNTLVVAEVKTRSSRTWEEPYQAVDRKKQKLIIAAADAYVRRKNLDLDVRFDVIYVVMTGKDTEIEHIENAFYPLLR